MNKAKKSLSVDYYKVGDLEFARIGGTEEPYIASKGLIEAVNLAILLNRPLLIKGEPGCGKTRFAKAVAYELYQEAGDYKDYFDDWHIKSATKAKEGLYTYNFVDRLRDAQIYNQLSTAQQQKVLDAKSYVEYGPLGRSFYPDQKSLDKDKQFPKVVLIDEIDKADIDFPNDLLLELDELRFKVDEVKVKEENGEFRTKEIKAPDHAKPIIIITSNDEKKLPDAFLRRCLFYHIQFPTPDQLLAIIKAHFVLASPDKIKTAIQTFYHLREVMAGDENSGKKVSTSELIDWFEVIEAHQEDLDIEKLKDLPFSSVLLKSFEDHQKYLINKEHQKKTVRKYFS